MVYTTLEGVLHPDGRVTLPGEGLPSCPVRVLVTILEPAAEEIPTEPGDYLEGLTEYEERLARGEIRWQ
jgi:hypothetical protein